MIVPLEKRLDVETSRVDESPSDRKIFRHKKGGLKKRKLTIIESCVKCHDGTINLSLEKGGTFRPVQVDSERYFIIVPSPF
jgi:hypothetical protein